MVHNPRVSFLLLTAPTHGDGVYLPVLITNVTYIYTSRWWNIRAMSHCDADRASGFFQPQGCAALIKKTEGFTHQVELLREDIRNNISVVGRAICVQSAHHL
jgi:hypothetical protein